MANINKNEIGYNENTTANALMVQYKRGLAAPMDISEVFTSLTSAQQYAKKDPIAYAGQTIAVAGEGIKTEVYKITSGGTLVRLVDENDIKNLSGGTNNITTVTPDWNAVEGEDGYIKNKPLNIYFKKFNEYNPELISQETNADNETTCIYRVYGGWWENCLIKYVNTCYEITTPYQWYTINPYSSGNRNTFHVKVEEDWLDIRYNDYECSLQNIEDYLSISIDDARIPAELLNDAVLKTTPQTLSDDDKNQVLTNLGIKDKIENIDTPIVKGDGENSAVLKGENNQVISEGGVALGKDNFVGLKGWYINNFNTSTVHISNQNTELGEYFEDDNFNNPYEVGDIISIQIGSIFTNIGRIDYIKGNYMTFTPLRYFSVPQSDPEKRYYLWVLSKPNAGVVDLGQNAISYGLNNQSLSECAYAEGKNNKAFGKYAHVEGKENEAHYCSHAEGSNNIALGNTSHAEGTDNIALNSNTHVEGRYTSARGYASHAEGYGESVEINTEASGEGAHAEGRVTKAQGNYSHTEGQYTSAVGIASHAEGKGESVDNPNLASGNYSHVEGEKTKATNIAAHAEGIITTSSGKAAHAEGRETQALADYSHAEGYLSSVVSGAIGGHSEGVYNIVNNPAEHASGKYNVSIPKTADNTTADATHFSIGIGTSDTVRKNAFEVKQNGDVYITGIGGFDGANYDNAKSVQDTIKELTETVKNLNDIIKQITITE